MPRSHRRRLRRLAAPRPQGRELANEPGAFCWNELQTRDTARHRFLRRRVRMGTHTNDMPGMPYTEWRRGDDTIGGMMDMPAEVPPQIPAYWLVYFAVDDCDAAVAWATELGGAPACSPPWTSHPAASPCCRTRPGRSSP